MLDNKLIKLVEQIKLESAGKFIATAESCTGGLVASYLTSIPGSSEYFSTGIVSYSNEAKIKLLNVNKKTLDDFGAVSEEVASEMALGAIRISGSDLAISVTGVAGPDGGTISKPIGMVCFGIATSQSVKTVTHNFLGDRHEIRKQSCQVSLNLILEALRLAFLPK
jgi:nicotinamide-nucleotide amidase